MRKLEILSNGQGIYENETSALKLPPDGGSGRGDQYGRSNLTQTLYENVYGYGLGCGDGEGKGNLDGKGFISKVDK